MRGAAFCNQAPKLNFPQLCGRIMMTLAARMNSVRKYLLPRLEIPPRMDRPPVLYCRGTRPSHALLQRGSLPDRLRCVDRNDRFELK